MLKVMIVDDEILARVGIKSLIPWEENGFEIVGEAENGKKALEMAGQLLPDIIITDIKMPLMDGIELIKASKKKGYDARFIVLSSYNDFEYVKEAMKLGAEDYILKLKMESEELLKILGKLKAEIQTEKEEYFKEEKRYKENIIVLRQEFFKNLILGHINETTQVEGKTQELGIKLSQDNLICLAVSLNNKDTLSSTMSSSENSVLNHSILNLMQEFLSMYRWAYTCCISLTEFVVIYSIEGKKDSQHMKESAVKMAESIRGSLKNYLNVVVNIGISSVCNKYTHLSLGYKQALKAAAQCFDFGKGRVIQFDDIYEKAREKNFLTCDNELENLEKMLEVMDFEKAKNILDDIKKKLMSTNNIEKESVSGLCWSIVFIINSFAKEVGLLFTDIWGEHYEFCKQIDYSSTLTDFIDWITQLESKLGNLMENISETNATIIKTMQYIEKYYQEDLSLKTVADKMNLSPNYLSNLFKKETGRSFTDYLTDIRIEHSKKFLRKSEYKIYEIAEKVGYHDIYYFSKKFKKVTGISPNQYRVNLTVDF